MKIKSIIYCAMFGGIACFSCKKQAPSTNSETPVVFTQFDFDSYWYYGGQSKNGSAYLNFRYLNDGTSTNDAAFAHNVYSGKSSPTGWQHLKAVKPVNNNDYAYLQLAIYHPGGGALPYPKIKKYVKQLYDSLKSIKTTVVNTVPNEGKLSFNSSYDMYFDKIGQTGSNYLAMMVWLKQVGPYGPAGNALSWWENNQMVTEVEIDKVRYKLVGRTNFSGHDNIINFITTTPTDSLTHNTLNLMKFLNNKTFYHKDGSMLVNLSGSTFTDINYGWEIHYAYNQSDSVNFVMKKFNIEIK